MKFTSNSERAPYSRSKHGSFNIEEFNVEEPLKRKPWRRCCCCTIIAFSVLLLVLFIVGLTLYLVLKPKYPSVEMSNIKVGNMKVTPKRDGLKLNALLSMNITANLTAINPNRFRITYSPTEADVSYIDLYVGNSTVPAIDQPGRSNHTISVLLVTDKIDVFKGTGLSLLKDFAKDAIPFTVVGTIRARIHFLGITSSLLTVKVTCDIVVHSRNQTLLEKTCKAVSWTPSKMERLIRIMHLLSVPATLQGAIGVPFQQPKGCRHCKKDEVQYVTELFRYLITRTSDFEGKPGKLNLTFYSV